jgi:hypothetical protein
MGGVPMLSEAAQAHLNAAMANTTLVNSGAIRQTVPRYTDVINVNPAISKYRAAIERATAQLPMRVAARITAIVLRRTTSALKGASNDAAFVVVFDDGRELRFEELDAFPADEDIARIALECP